MQSNIVIPNGTGNQFRNAVNNAFMAVSTGFMGSSAPTPTYANMPWTDTSGANPVVKVRSADNTSWITIGTIVAGVFQPANALLNTDSNVVKYNDTYNAANKLLKFNGSNQYPAADGRLITFINDPPIFTINSSNVDATTGQPNYLTGIGTGTLTLNAGGSYANVVASYADGLIQTISSNLTVAVPAGTYWFPITLYGRVTPKLHCQVMVPAIQSFAPTGNTGLPWLDVSVYPRVLKRYYSSSWQVASTIGADYDCIILGYAHITSGVLDVIIHYPLNNNFIDNFNNDIVNLGTISSGTVYFAPNMKYILTSGGSLTFNIPEVPTGQEINIQFDIKVTATNYSFTWSKTIDWMSISAPLLNDTTQTYEICLTYKPITATWEGRWSFKIR